MALLQKRRARLDAVRFRDDDPGLFGIEVGEGPGDADYVRGLREHLSHSVEVVPELFPDVARAVEEVRATLLPDEQCRAFVSSDPAVQAYCMGGKQEDTVVIGFTSGLLRLLDLDELRFVIGHEIGHYAMGHHRRIPPDDAAIGSINYRTLQRMAEISADRVGRLACASGDHAFRALLKTASGLDEGHLRFDLDAVMDQLRRLRGLDGFGDARGTHPLFTVRCRALSLFENSEPHYAASGRRDRAALSTGELDEQVAAELFASTGYHPVAEMEKSVRLALIWVVLRLFVEDDRFSKEEQRFVRDNFDAEIADKAIEFVRQHGPQPVHTKHRAALETLASMADAVRASVCEVVRRVASVAGGTVEQRLRIVQQVHAELRCDAPARIERWDDADSLGGLIDLR